MTDRLDRLKSGKGPAWVLGSMSGTSLDGVDVALLLTDGTRIFDFGAYGFLPYGTQDRAVLTRALGKWPGEPGVAEAAEIVETAHMEAMSDRIGDEVALLAFHGQTLAHDPAGKGTHQVGNGQHLAQALGRPTAWDFRTSDVGFGGEGAPLAPFYHHACARFIQADAPLGFVNMGGVGNLTWADPRLEAPELPNACLAFDTGPANAPINDLMQARLGKSYDEDGVLALSGSVDERVVERFLEHEYFRKAPPKSLDRNDFPNLLEEVAHLSDVDAARTLVACAAAAVAKGLHHCPSVPARVLVTGGGRHNSALMAELASRLPVAVENIDDAGLNGDMLEAQAFAYLAARVARGLPTSAPGTTGVSAPVGGGIVSMVNA